MSTSKWILGFLVCASTMPSGSAMGTKWIVGKSSSPHNILDAAKTKASAGNGEHKLDTVFRALEELAKDDYLTQETSRVPLHIATGKGVRTRWFRSWQYESHLVQTGPTVVLNRIYADPYWSFPQFFLRYGFGIMPKFERGESHVLSFDRLRGPRSRKRLYADFPSLTVDDLEQALENYQRVDSRVPR